MTAFGPLFVPEALRDAVSGQAWLEAMLDAESALATAEAAAGVIPADAAVAIAERCDPDLFDFDELLEQGRAVGNPAEPLVRALREAVGGDAAGFVHHGATSQDIMDTATMLVARGALDLVLADAPRRRSSWRRSPRRTDRRRWSPARCSSTRSRRPSDSRPRDGSSRCSMHGSGWSSFATSASQRSSEAPRGRSRPWASRAWTSSRSTPTSSSSRSRCAVAHEQDARSRSSAPRSTRAPACSRRSVSTSHCSRRPRSARCAREGRAGRRPSRRSGTRFARPMPARAPSSCTATRRCSRARVVQEHERAAGAWHAEWEALTGALAYTGAPLPRSARRSRGSRSTRSGCAATSS